MIYRVVPHEAARAQLGGCPGKAVDALIETLAVIAVDPWDPLTTSATGAGPRFRRARFGDSGLVSCYIDDEARLIIVHDITWAG